MDPDHQHLNYGDGPPPEVAKFAKALTRMCEE